MARRSFLHRAETFGLDTPQPWALPALRLLFHAPRVYQPLLDAWDGGKGDVRKAMDRLVEGGFAAYQPPVIVDIRAQQPVASGSRRLARYRTTAKGTRLVVSAKEDLRELERLFPRTTTPNAQALLKLLDAFDLDDSHARFGLSAPHAVATAKMAERTGRWWIQRLVAGGYIKQLDVILADKREVIPAHWRVTRTLCRQIDDVLAAYPDPHGALAKEFRLHRSRFLTDIDPARIGISGATDYDHDVETQRILAILLQSPRAATGGVFDIEPRIVLELSSAVKPWGFEASGDKTAFYQPDAILTERDDETRRCIVEYERFQTRRDAWSHIERFLGYLAMFTFPFESGVLRFVVDTESRLRGYVELIEAFADYALDNPDRMPPNKVWLAASSVERVAAAADPLDAHAWFRIALPSGPGLPRSCRLHDPEDSPYNEFFARQ